MKCRRILLVEDHPDTAHVLVRVLRRNGYEVTCAGSVSAGLSALRSAEFDLLLCDIGLPDGTGLDLIRQAREQLGLQIPAIALTGFGMDDDVAKSKVAGFNEHLTKPVNLSLLENTIQRTLEPSTPA